MASEFLLIILCFNSRRFDTNSSTFRATFQLEQSAPPRLHRVTQVFIPDAVKALLEQEKKGRIILWVFAGFYKLL